MGRLKGGLKDRLQQAAPRLIKAILLDLDDTLLQETASRKWAVGLFHLYFQNQMPWSAAEFSRIWEAAIKKHYPRFLAGELTFEEHRRQRMRDIFRTELPDEEADLRFGVFLRHYEESWTLFPDVLPFLEKCRNAQLAVVTNGQGLQQRYKLEKTGLLPFFQTVVISEESGFSKPDPRIFQEACRRLSLRPEDCLYIGDSYEVDFVGSRQAGLKPVWLRRDSKEGAPPAITVVHNLMEIQVG